MSLDEFYNNHNGQSLLWAANASREPLRGQCVQLVCFYVSEVWGKPVIWDDAYGWFVDGRLSDQYDRIANNHADPNQVPPRGAVIVWGPNTPGSGGLGHIAIVWDARPGSATFVSFDSNWGGKAAHLVTHNWSNVVGWLVPKGAAPGPAPAPAPQGGDEMIANETQARQAYGLLRPNAQPSAEEIAGTAGKRSWQQFANDAKTEVSQRDANLRAQAEAAANLQATINQLNTTITELQTQGVKTKQEYDAKVAEIAGLTTQLTDSHDQLKQLQDAIAEGSALPQGPQQPAADQPGLFVRIIAALLRRKGQ